MCFNLFLLVWKSVDGTDSTTGYLVLLSIYGNCVPRLVWDVGYLDWFFSVSFSSYLALIALVNSSVDHAVHQWEPVFFSQPLLGLGFS